MYSCLRPELRGSRRILRLVEKASAQPNPRTAIRSFSSFSRLHEKSNPPKDDANPSGRAKDHNDNINRLFIFGSSFTNPDPDAPVGLPTVKELLDKHIQERRDIDSHLQNGEIPPGYRRVENLGEVPPEWRERIENENDIEPPFLFTDLADRSVKITPVPELFQAHRLQETEQSSENEGRSLESAPFRDFDPGFPSSFYGSSGARRMRARAARSQNSSHKSLPSWFFEHNILSGYEQPSELPPIEVVKRLENGNYMPVRFDRSFLNQSTVEADKDSEATPKLGIGGSSDPSESNTEHDESRSEKAQQPVIENDGQRYYIEAAQYYELWTTVTGRLYRTPETTPRGQTSSMAVNNLNIEYAAPNADLLLISLVQNLAKSCSAKYASLDVQDISTLIARADLDPAIAEEGTRLSYRIYQDIYGRPPAATESTPAGLEEEPEFGDEDENPGPMGSALPTIHIPMVVEDLSKGLSRLRGGSRFDRKNNNLFSRFFGDDANTRDGSVFQGIVDSVLSSISQKKFTTGESATQPKQDLERDKAAGDSPVIIHLRNYKAIQDNHLANGFWTELHNQVERRIASGQKIMVIGTDSVSDQTLPHIANDVEDMWREQDEKSHAFSTSITITPTFPTKEAEMLLMQDRKRRIQMINARHLWNALQAIGIPLKGFKEGFWRSNSLPELTDEDRMVLSLRIYTFDFIQRLAAILAGANAKTEDDLSVAKAHMALFLSDSTKTAWAKRNMPDRSHLENGEAHQVEERRLTKIREKATRHEKRLLSGVVEPKKISTTFNDIHIPAETIDALKTLTTLSLVRPEAFRYGVLKSDRIPGLLLYGPPGTGKTLAAKAVAKESGATMLEVSAADLNDMYVGEGEKNVKALFSLARKLSPCVVFLDEADAMFSARATQGKRVSHRELVNQFLKEWDGMNNDSGSAFLMVATNRPMDLDDAVLRRLPRRLLVDLPTENDRFEILKIHLRQEKLADDVDLTQLASKTPFYSGSDLKNVAVAAALNCVREENEAAKKHRGEAPYHYPEKRTLHAHHFEQALEEISASISQDMSSLKDIKRFDEQFGDKRGRKSKAARWGFRSPSEADQKLDTVKVRS